jgi:hypothetical protein
MEINQDIFCQFRIISVIEGFSLLAESGDRVDDGAVIRPVGGLVEVFAAPVLLGGGFNRLGEGAVGGRLGRPVFGVGSLKN